MLKQPSSHDICEAMPDMLVVADRDTLRIRYTNPAVQTITGYSQADLNQLTLLDLYPAPYRANVLDAVALLDTENRSWHEIPLVCGNDRIVAIETRLSLANFDGTPSVICVAREISAWQPAADMTIPSGYLGQKIVEEAPIGIVVFDRLGCVTQVNRAQLDLSQVFDRTPEDFVGISLLENNPVIEQMGLQASLRLVLEGDSFEREIKILVPQTGETAYVMVRGGPLCGMSGGVIGGLMVVEDITEYKKNEILYRSLIDGIPDLLFRIHRDGTYLDFKLPEGLGLNIPPSPDFIIGKKVEDVVPKHVTERVMPVIERVLDTGEIESVEYQILEPSGLHYYEARFVVSGENEVLAVVRDITERKLAEEALRESEQTARALLNAITDTAMLIDTNRTILAVNEGGAKRLGKTVEELTNSSLYSFHTIIPSDLATERARQADEVIHSGSPRCFQDQYGGRYFDHLFYPVFDAHGAVTRLALYTRDITEQKQSEETLCRQRMLLQGVAQATTRLLATSDYEAGINNALTIMGETLGVDRIHIFEYHPHSKTSDMLISLRFEWAGETTEPRLDDPLLQNFPIRESGLAYWYDQLVADGFAGGIVRNFAEQAQSFFAARNILSLQVVPVLVDDEVWGIIAFEDCHAEREWEKTEINVLQTMAVSVGAAIKRSQFEGQLRREREIADTLREIGTELTSTLDLDEVLGRLLDQVGRVVPYDTANVMLIRDGTTHIESFTNYDHFGLSADEVRQITFRIDKSPIMKHIVQTRKPYVCSHTRDEPHWIKIHRVDWIESWLGVPIEVWGKVVGFFSLDSTQPGFYGQEHIDLMDLFAQQAANAFKNAMLFANTQELEQLKSRMIRIASHDLRSPLTRIIGATELLEEELDAQLTSNQSELLNKIWKAIRQMEQIINDILSLERIEAYHQKLEPVLWRALINRAVDDLRADLEAKQHTLQIECEPDLPTTRGDPAQLGQALTNLVSNAIKYTPPGGQITIRAFVRDYDGKPTLTVEVEDHGIGIPRERQTRLFQPFYRARQAGAEDIPGVGLGLSAVKTTIEQHYGNVYCHSEPGQGSTFGFWVPV